MPTEANAVLSDEQIAEISARADAASRGPWSQSALASAYIVGRHTDDFPVICALAEYKEDSTLHLEFDNAENNMAFVAHARQDIPALCATVKALRARLMLCEGEVTAADPDKWGHESKIQLLKKRLSEVERERDTARELATAITVEKQKVESLLATVRAEVWRDATEAVQNVTNENELDDGGFFEAGFIAARTKCVDVLLESARTGKVEE